MQKFFSMENTKFVITVNREFGSGGREIAIRLGELLGVKVYDKSIVASLTEQYNLSNDEIERIKAKKVNWWSEFCRFYSQHASVAAYTGGRQLTAINREISSMELYEAESKILRELAGKESCIIVGRTGFHIFKDNPNAIRIFLIADYDSRLKRIMEKHGLEEEAARKEIEEYDNSRENFTKAFAKTSRYDARNYDCVLRVSPFTTEQIAQFMAHNIRLKYPQ